MSEEHYPGEADEASCTPLLDTQAMTREQIILVESGGQDAVNFAVAQAETIRRLEETINKADYRLIMDPPDGGDPSLLEKAQYLVDRLNHATVELGQLQARLTASEAKGKWTTQPTHDGWHWWRRPYGKKILVTIVRVKKNWGNGKLYVYAGKRTEDCKGSWQGPLTPGEE